MKIAVIGAGVVGLVQALELAPDHDVTVFADLFAADTNSVKATAMWHLFLVKLHRETLAEKPVLDGDVHLEWAFETLETLCAWAESPGSGVRMVPGTEIFRSAEPEKMPAWTKRAAGSPTHFRMLTPDEVASLNALERAAISPPPPGESEILYGYRLTTPVADMAIHLPWLLEQARLLGARFIERRFADLSDAANGLQRLGFDVIINCTGVAAAAFADDRDMCAFRGHYFSAPSGGLELTDYLGDDENPDGMTYVVPRGSSVVVGGTAVPADRPVEGFTWERALVRAQRLYPALAWFKPADDEVHHIVCDRPVRLDGVRLETEISSKPPLPLVVHNYGHGGSGWSMCVGTARAVRRLLTAVASPSRL
ncbi:hypothetical protein DMC25_23215 [Caulobacter sp. D4A]|uniref:FAD-dependent oxidoreductase n=1 Tax=unclassified Caulobacter TaxID=2648921 RepID=UPI000D73D632|nr:MULTISPECIES: FAD-dependent oxidoreductase [unclassified Caulobacter]PXA77589.1 hypothetical protein DMC25_23215 [Caulobacter sp. D4A]PXA96143.1 hypothetical protein DMC18_02115 [Caulobacter sp. D5]